MKHRLALIAGVVAVALVVAGAAFAHDCMRVSSSMQGLKQSANSGNWLYFDMTHGGGGVAQVVGFFGLPASSVDCFQAAYDTSTGPRYFAIGVGVAGGDNGGPGALAWKAPDKVLMNGTGIDHFDESVLPIFLNALPTCLGT